MNWVGLTQFLGASYLGAVSLSKSFRLLQRGIQPVAVGSGKRGLAWWVEVLLPTSLVLWGWLIIRYSFHLQAALLPPAAHFVILRTPATQALGAALLLAAGVILSFGFAHFGDSWRIGVADPGRLVTHGLFRYSRNPIFVCLDLFWISIFLLNGTLILLVLCGLALVGVHYQILQEEQYLRARFGAPYERYLARTPRYVGWRRVQGSGL